MLSQKCNAEHAWRIGTLASSTARADTSCEMTQQKTRSTSSPFLISSLSRTFTSGRVGHTVTGTGRKKVIKNTTLQINSKRSVGRSDSWTFTIDLFVIHGSENHAGIGSHWRSDSRDGQTGERRHPHCHRRRTQRVSWQLMDTFEFCGFRHDADKASPWLQESIVNLASPQESRGWWSLLSKLVAKLFLIVVAMARFLVASLIWDITTTMDLTLIERGNLRNQWNVYLLVAWFSQWIWFTIYSDHFGNSQRSSLSPTGGVKSTSPITEKLLRKLYVYSMNNNMSDEDNKHDTNYITSTRMTRTLTRASCTSSGTARRARCFVVTP